MQHVAVPSDVAIAEVALLAAKRYSVIMQVLRRNVNAEPRLEFERQDLLDDTNVAPPTGVKGTLAPLSEAKWKTFLEDASRMVDLMGSVDNVLSEPGRIQVDNLLAYIATSGGPM